MKQSLILLVCTFLIFKCYSQKIDAKIIFKDSTELRDVFRSKGNELKSIKSKKRYHIDDMYKITYFNKKDTVEYDIIDVKTYITSRKSSRYTARKVYDGDKIELYYINFNYQSGGTVGMQIQNSYDEAFVKRKNEQFAYNIGYIYGIQYKGIKKRVKAYFKDCPALVEKVKKNEIKKKNTMEMVLFYDKNCGN